LQLPKIPPQFKAENEREEGAKVGGSYKSANFTRARQQTICLRNLHRTESKKNHDSPVSPQKEWKLAEAGLLRP
jgi:hypothetical protein